MSEVRCSSDENTLSAKGYRLLKLIGEGAYAKVYLTEYTFKDDSSKIRLACKIVETATAPNDFVVKFLPREIQVLVKLNHPHLIQVHSIFQRKTKYYIFMRFGENGDLLSHILKNGCVPENQARVWIRQIALGLQYLHELEIAHRDMKCENVILTANNNVKISDFGFTRFCVDEDDEPALSETYCGSLSYAAPEILRGKPYYPKATDLWSLGVVFFVMLNKSMPFDDSGVRKLYLQQMAKKYRYRSRVASSLSVECKSVVKHLLEPDPGLRYNATRLVNSKWIAMDSRLTTLNTVEASALMKAKEERRRIIESHKNVNKTRGDIIEIITARNQDREVNNDDPVEDLHFSPSEQLTLSVRGYSIIRKINEGSYAKVYLTEYRNPKKESKDKSTTLACKVIDVNIAPKDFVVKFLPREIKLLIKLNHPHLVHTHSIFQRRSKYFIFMRFMEQGDLLECILQRGVIQEDQARVWMRQIGLAIQYMHELEIAHRDIKCENVLLTANHNAKLSDFGFSRYCVDSKCNNIYSETFCGSLSYTAPEILHGSPYYPKPTDMWSLGVVLYVMMNRCMPFQEKHVKSLYKAQKAKKWRFRSKYAESVSESCKNLVSQMLEPNLQQRLKVEELINSEWIAMDSRLLEWSPQELSAYQKAKDERMLKLNQVSEITNQELDKSKPETAIMHNVERSAASMSW